MQLQIKTHKCWSEDHSFCVRLQEWKNTVSTHPGLKEEIFGFLTKNMRTLPNVFAPKMLSDYFAKKELLITAIKRLFRWIVSDETSVLLMCLCSVFPIWSPSPTLQQSYDVLYSEIHLYNLCMSKKLHPVTKMISIGPKYICSSSSKYHLVFPKFITSNMFSAWVYLHFA